MQIIGTSDAAQRIRSKATTISQENKNTVALAGPDGSGKTRIARFIHHNSHREAEPFIIFDAKGSDNPEKEIFGQVKTSFLGKTSLSKCAIDEAGAGTLFIKNLQCVPLKLQLQLLATIQLGGYKPIGATHSIKSLCRYIFSMPQHLKKYIEDHQLIPELAQLFVNNYIEAPPLKERLEDIEPLAKYFVNHWCINFGIPGKEISRSAMKLLKRTPWTGNIAELNKTMLFAVISANGDSIDTNDLNLHIDNNWDNYSENQIEQLAIEELVERKLKIFMQQLGKYDVKDLHEAIIKRVEKPLIRLVMERTKGNQIKAARILGINRNTLRTKLNKLELRNS